MGQKPVQIAPDVEFPMFRYKVEDGKLHIFFDSDVVFHYKNKTEEISGSYLEYVSENKFNITGGFLHLNPWGGNYYDIHLSQFSKNPEIRDVMEAKEQLYSKKKKEQVFKSLKERLKYRMQNYLRRKNGCICNE